MTTPVESIREYFYVQHSVPNSVSIDVPKTEYINHTATETIVLFQEDTTVLVAGQQGPPGIPGISEEDVVYSKRIDFISDDVLYKGEAPVGSSESSPVWRVRRITVGIDGDVTEVWAGGSAEFANTWAGRTGFIYS